MYSTGAYQRTRPPTVIRYFPALLFRRQLTARVAPAPLIPAMCFICYLLLSINVSLSPPKPIRPPPSLLSLHAPRRRPPTCVSSARESPITLWPTSATPGVGERGGENEMECASTGTRAVQAICCICAVRSDQTLADFSDSLKEPHFCASTSQ